MTENNPKERKENNNHKNKERQGMDSRTYDIVLGGLRTSSTTVDTDSLMMEVQKRVWKSLKTGFEYPYRLSRSQEFLRQYAKSRRLFGILMVDLAKSTEMVLELPIKKIATIIGSFSQEMGYVIESHEGYVLKYLGDAVVGFFDAQDYSPIVADRMVECARSMQKVVKESINPIMEQYGYPELSVKIGVDMSECHVLVYGENPQKSPIDILGPAMFISERLTEIAKPDQVLVSEAVYDKLHPEKQQIMKAIEIANKDSEFHDMKAIALERVYNASS